MKKLFTLFTAIMLFSCSLDSKENNFNDEKSTVLRRQSIRNNQQMVENKVLMLKVDYTTNTFEGGKELAFANPSTTFTVTNQYLPPGDFGSIQLNYSEINQQLFFGTIFWMGLGQISFPNDFLPASSFGIVNTLVAIPFPSSGFENVFNPNNQVFDYNPVWNAIAYRGNVMQYRASNPNATIKIFLYTPSVGIGNPAEWKWIIMLKN
jgi:hypothetical protein